ncbi:MAG: hypothetical protein KDN19_00300 [Verrucomicrobiae bacterium]|nr:hypothetical protein [Verrucomicrobiae bacterium]
MAILTAGTGLSQADNPPTLTSDQIANIRVQLEEIRMVVDGHVSKVNQSAGSVFRQAAQNPKAAVELYVKCYKMVNYERNDRDQAEFRDWEDRQEETFKDPRFLEGLLTQLRYLALSCEAAEADELKDVFPSILAYVDSLSQLTELPGTIMLQPVDNSIFADAYRLKELLARNENWEMVPFNIAGIYEKTVLPYLRENDPSRLIGAWDRRIEQQTQMVRLFSELEEKGNNREERRMAEARNRQLQQGRAGNLVKDYDQFDFQTNTLPTLQWERLKDMALFVDPVQGVAGMLSFVKSNTEHPKVSEWLDQLGNVVNQIGSRREATQTSAPPARPAAASPATPAAATTTPAGSGGVSGNVPRGLE